MGVIMGGLTCAAGTLNLIEKSCSQPVVVTSRSRNSLLILTSRGIFAAYGHVPRNLGIFMSSRYGWCELPRFLDGFVGLTSGECCDPVSAIGSYSLDVCIVYCYIDMLCR